MDPLNLTQLRNEDACGMSLVFESKDKCLLCLRSTVNIKTAEINLRDICRYLKIFPPSFLTKTLQAYGDISDDDKSMLDSISAKSQFAGIVCVQCFPSASKLTNFIQELELTQMLLFDQLKDFTQILQLSETSCEQEIIDENTVEAKLVGILRHEMMNKCKQELKALFGGFPKVVITRMKKEKPPKRVQSPPPTLPVDLTNIKQEMHHHESSPMNTKEPLNDLPAWNCPKRGCGRIFHLPKNIRMHKRICNGGSRRKAIMQKITNALQKIPSENQIPSPPNAQVLVSVPNFEFSSQQPAQNQGIAVRQELLDVSGWKRKEKRFKCPHCQGLYTAKQIHLVACHTEIFFVEHKLPNISDDVFIRLCKQVLQGRRTIVDAHDKSKIKIKCEHCIKVLTSSCNMRLHGIKTHFPELVEKLRRLQEETQIVSAQQSPPNEVSQEEPMIDPNLSARTFEDTHVVVQEFQTLERETRIPSVTTQQEVQSTTVKVEVGDDNDSSKMNSESDYAMKTMFENQITFENPLSLCQPVIKEEDGHVNLEENGLNSEDLPFGCPTCGKRFREMGELYIHGAMNHLDAIFFKSKLQNVTRDVFKTQCELALKAEENLCPKSTASTGEISIQCRYCQEKLWDEMIFRVHLCSEHGEVLDKKIQLFQIINA